MCVRACDLSSQSLWKAISHSASRFFSPLITWKFWPHVNILRQFNQVYFLLLNLLKMRFSIILPSTLRLLKWPVPLWFFYQNFTWMSVLSIRATCCTHPIFLNCIAVIIFGELHAGTAWIFPKPMFFPRQGISTPLAPQQSSRHLVLPLKPSSYLKLIDQAPRPCKTIILFFS